MDDFEKELKSGFLEEASQLLADAEGCFLILESNPKDIPTIEKIFRIAHNIKGSSKAVGFDSLGVFTHEFESFLLKCKSGEIPILPSTISLLLKCTDVIRATIDLLKSDFSAVMDYGTLVDELHHFVPDAESASAPAPVPEEATPTTEEAEALAPVEPETLSPPQPQPQSQPQPQVAAPPAKPAAGAGGGTPATDESIRVSLARLEKLINFVGEMVILQTVLREQAYTDNTLALRKTIHQIGKVTKEVQDLSMSLRMVPLKQTFQKMQRIVRDTSTLLGKKVQLILQGEDTEVDKTVLEALGDPLVHLIRNAVDHGVEMPADRLARGKPETGTVMLRAFHQGGQLVIEIKDDGAGIPAAKLRQKAIDKGILKPGQVISDKEAVHLIFHSGFSTKSQVTEISGRGVGMDVVKTNIEQMQGEIVVDTIEGQGSTFRVILPLTLAIIDGMVVRSGEYRYVIPLGHVHESVKPEANDLFFSTGLGEFLLLRGENLPVMRLSQALGRKASTDKNSPPIAIIVRTTEQPFAVLVDEVIGQHQVVIKKLGAELQNIRGFSGSAILGDGKPALILELGELFQSASPQRQRQVSA